MGEWWRDLRLAWRTLARNKSVTLVAVLTLALGIGLNTTFFSGVHAFLWTPFPYPQSEQLVWLAQSNPSQGFQQASISYLDAEDWRGAKSLEAVTAYRFTMMGLSGSGEPANVSAVAATPELFRLLRVEPALGRGFGPPEQGPGEHRVVVISDGLWRRQFGADRNVIGREIRLDGKSYTVIGVLPPDFTFLYEEVGAFLPLYVPPQTSSDRGHRSLMALGRLRPGVSVAQAQAEIQMISERMEREAPGTNQGWKGRVTGLEERVIPRDARLASHTALLAVTFVLLIACANIANLLLARGALRRRELAIRASLGAGRGSLVRLLLAESIVLAVAGGVLGVVVAYWGMPILKNVAPPETPRLELMRLNASALLYTLGLCLATGLAAGAAPAGLLSRSEPARALQDSSWGSTGRRQGALKALVVAQVALAVVLLAASGLMIRSLDLQANASPGFDQKNLLIARVSLAPARYPTRALVASFFQSAVGRLRGQAQVLSAAAVDNLPLGGSYSHTDVSIEGRPSADPRERQFAGRSVITPGFFRTLGIRLVAGREFEDRDGAEAPAVAVVNATMAQRYWSDVANALGRRFKMGTPAGPSPWLTVVGVAKDVRYQGVAQAVRPQFYLPHAQSPAPAMTLIARTAGDPGRLAGDMRAAVWSVDRDQPLYQVEALEDMLARRMASSRALTQILGFLAGLALLLAAIGIYGVVAYMAGQRTREIGMRMALGAQQGDIFRMVLRSGVSLMVAGLAIGLPCAYGITPLLRSLLAGVQPHDWRIFVAVPAILLVVASVACSLPARRATRLDPVATLRVE